MQVGNSTVIQQNVNASNGVLHLIDSFPLSNAAFNTSMIASLEAAGDFGPFNESQVLWLIYCVASVQIDDDVLLDKPCKLQQMPET